MLEIFYIEYTLEVQYNFSIWFSNCKGDISMIIKNNNTFHLQGKDITINTLWDFIKLWMH